MKNVLFACSFVLVLPMFLDAYRHSWLTWEQIFMRHYSEVGAAAVLATAAVAFWPRREQ